MDRTISTEDLKSKLDRKQITVVETLAPERYREAHQEHKRRPQPLTDAGRFTLALWASSQRTARVTATRGLTHRIAAGFYRMNRYESLNWHAKDRLSA